MIYTLYQRLVRSNEAQLLRQIYSDLEYLGMIKKYGSCCLFINTLAAEILKSHSFEVELTCCNAIIEFEDRASFSLGGQEFATAGQIPTHVVCIINKTVLLDFGLGNVRRYFDADFFQAMLLPVAHYGAEEKQVICSAIPRTKQSITYIAAATPAMLNEEIVMQQGHLEQCLAEYHRYARHRLRFNVTRALRKLYNFRPRLPNKSTELNRLVGNFDDTLFD